MAQGFLGGLVWGGVVGAGMLFVSSQTLERQELSLPQPEATAVEVPGGTEFDQAREETDPVLPSADARPDAGAGGLAEVPQDAVDAPPSFDTTALQVPTPAVGEAGGLSPAPSIGNAPEAPEASEEARPEESGADLAAPENPGAAPKPAEAAPQPETPEPEGEEQSSAPVAEGAAPESTDLAALPATGADETPGVGTGAAPAVGSETNAPTAMAAPDVGDTPVQPESGSDASVTTRLPQVTQPETPESAGAAPEIAGAPEQPTLPEAGSDTDSPELAEDDAPSLLQPVESFEDKAENVETNRLPRIGAPAENNALPGVRRLGNDNAAVEVETPDPETDPEAEKTEEDTPSGPAIRAHGMEFVRSGDAPLLALVLVHDANAPPGDALMAKLPEAVAIAIDAGAGDAADLAAAYRALGREVVMIPALPDGAQPQDVEQALRVNFDTVPEAVAIMDVSGSSFQSDRAAVQQVVDVVAATGHGLITFPRGLNTAHQSASRAGVPAGLILKRLDSSGESTEQIRRNLDRAAFRARNDAAVILVGTTAEGTISAILNWAENLREDTLTIAPISAALLNE